MQRNIGVVIVGCVLVVIGIASGWYAAKQGEVQEEDEHAAHAESGLSEQALANLGVEIGKAELRTYQRTVNVQGTVIDAPLNLQPVRVQMGGIVRKLYTAPGELVRAGDPIASVVRQPIARPSLSLTADILTPVSEQLHESVAALRTASAAHGVVERELARVRKFAEADPDGLPILPRKTLIDLEYDLARVEQDKKNAEQELERHGLTKAEIEAVRGGAHAPPNQRLWKRALQHNSLWGATEEAILAKLPEAARDQPWAIAAIGELSAAGLTTMELARALESEVAMSQRFVEAAALILTGSPVERVRLLAAHGALEPIMILRAPKDAEDWDVSEIHVSLGDLLQAGDAVADLHDPRKMWIRLEPVGAELGAVAKAVEAQTEVSAHPLLAGTGPALTKLRIARMETRGAQEERGALAFVYANNTPVPRAGSGEKRPGPRSWRLRVGLRYLIAVPVEVYEKRFVLPLAAVTMDGAERVVMLPDGATFRPQAVHVEYEDDKIVVLANDGSLFPGDPVVIRGAFALGLALQAGSGAVDPHAGHDHG
ncbi:MAG: hypothetical protein V3T86_16920 [Planctomycetota bacterium]